MELFPGLHWIPLRASNVYLCVEERWLTLVDAGIPREADRILAYIEQIGRHPHHLTRILITHADIDHAGSAAQLAKRTGAQVLAGAETAHYLARGRSPEHLPRLIHRLTAPFLGFDPVPDVRQVAEDESLPCLDGLIAIPTPGHTPDHHAFYSPSTGVLFAGDALQTRDERLSLMPAFITGDPDAARRSARRLLDLTPALFACGHGPPLREHNAGDLMRLAQAL